MARITNKEHLELAQEKFTAEGLNLTKRFLPDSELDSFWGGRESAAFKAWTEHSRALTDLSSDTGLAATFPGAVETYERVMSERHLAAQTARLIAAQAERIDRLEQLLTGGEWTVQQDENSPRDVTITLSGDGLVLRKHKLRFPVMLYRGVYQAGKAYERGDVVTHDGSTWHCNAEKSAARPGTSDDWTLQTKRGRDSRDRD